MVQMKWEFTKLRNKEYKINYHRRENKIIRKIKNKQWKAQLGWKR